MSSAERQLINECQVFEITKTVLRHTLKMLKGNSLNSNQNSLFKILPFYLTLRLSLITKNLT